MTREEFNGWWNAHGRVFPETAAWVNGLGQAGKSTLLAAWADVMGDVDSRDAHEVTKRMLAGTDEMLAAFDREKTPGHIRRLAWNLKQGRGEVNREPILPVVRNGKPFPMSGLLADLMLARDEGATPEQLQPIIAEFKAKHCTPEADDAGPRFHCATCKDSGMVLCWGPSAMAAMRTEGIDAVRKLNSPLVGCLCSCRRGDRSSEGAMKTFGRYNVANLHLCPRGDFRSEANLMALERDWEAGKAARYASKRESSFDTYNQSEFPQ